MHSKGEFWCILSGIVEGEEEGVPAEGGIEEGQEEGIAEGHPEGIVEGEDGFLSVDQNHDGLISLSELLRVIQFFNSGGYHYCPGEGTEDGYCPGLV